MPNVDVILFDGFDEMDAVGPYEVFRSAGELGADVDARLVTATETDAVSASHGMRVVPDGVLGDPDPDVLLVPGGGWSRGEGGVRRAVETDLPETVARYHAAGVPVASVCTGAMVLAEAGVLDDRPATTHHVAHDDLAEVAAFVEARVVDAGDVVTCGGITSGLDLALYLVERWAGADVADEVAWEMEYERRGEVYREA